MTPAERAARTYFDAWVEPDRDRRAALLEACFAIDGRIALRGQVMPLQAEDVGEVDGDGRIAVLYAFARTLRAAAPA